MSRLPTSFEIGLPGCFLAGGSILSTVTHTEINDYDVYPKSNEAMIEAFYQLIDDDCFVVNISDRAVTFKSNNITNDKKERAIIQVMTYDTFETADKIFENFDFSVCMGAFDFDTKTYTFHQDFYQDIASKTLRFNPKTRYPLNSMLRVNKYHSKGFFISKFEMVRMLLTVIQQGAPTSWEELESMIGGAYGRQIKISADDTPFSMQAAMDRLEELSWLKDSNFSWLCDPSEFDKYSDVGGEELELLFSTTPVTMIVNSNDDYFTLSEDESRPAKKIGDIKPRASNVINSDSEYRLMGYKVLKVNGDGTMIPGIQTSSDLTYKIGDETVEEKSPYLFVFPSYADAKERLRSLPSQRRIFKVSYDAKDLRCVKKHEIQVTRMRVEEDVTDVNV